jgi:hypothetical protein
MVRVCSLCTTIMDIISITFLIISLVLLHALLLLGGVCILLHFPQQILLKNISNNYNFILFVI